MTQLKSDKCIFRHIEKDLYLTVHIDDGIIFSKDNQNINELLLKLKEEFEIKVCQNPKVYLGIEINKTKDGLFLTQRSYKRQVVEKFGMTDSKGADTPLLPGDYGVQRTEKQRFPYRAAVGSLLYMTCKTRPDMAYSVNYESQFLDNPPHKNIQDVKRTLRYWKENQTCGTQYTKNFDTLKIKAFSDSDYAGM
jgi:hypothetical protein